MLNLFIHYFHIAPICCYDRYDSTGRSLSLKPIEQLCRQISILGVSVSSQAAATTTGLLIPMQSPIS